MRKTLLLLTLGLLATGAVACVADQNAALDRATFSATAAPESTHSATRSPRPSAALTVGPPKRVASAVKPLLPETAPATEAPIVVPPPPPPPPPVVAAPPAPPIATPAPAGPPPLGVCNAPATLFTSSGGARGWVFDSGDPEGWIAKVSMTLTVCVQNGVIAWSVPHAEVTTTTGVTGNLWPGTPFYTEQSAATVNVMAPATFLYEETRAEPSVHLRYTVGTGFTVIEGHQPFR